MFFGKSAMGKEHILLAIYFIVKLYRLLKFSHILYFFRDSLKYCSDTAIFYWNNLDISTIFNKNKIHALKNPSMPP